MKIMPNAIRVQMYQSKISKGLVQAHETSTGQYFT